MPPNLPRALRKGAVSSYPAGAAAGSYIASVSSSSFFFFLLLLSVNIAISPTAYMV